MTNSKPILWKRNILVGILLLFVCCLTYSNSLDNAFMMDDFSLIVRNPAIRDPGFLQWDFFSPKQTSSQLTDISQHIYFRPVAHSLSSLGFVLFDQNPRGYHVMNLSFFYLAALSVYLLTTVLFRNPMIALITGLLFSTHPFQGMIVNYITATGYAVMIITMCLSLQLMFKYLEERGSIGLYIGSLLLFGISLLCHETAIFLPFYAVSMCLCLSKISVKRAVGACAGLFILLIGYMIFRQNVAVLNGGFFLRLQETNITFMEYLATLSALIWQYFINIFLLKDIVLIFSSSLIKTNGTWWCLSLFGLFILSIASVCFWRRSPLSNALIWIWIGIGTLAVACFSRPMLGLIMQTHWLFFSTLGIYMLVAAGITFIFQRIRQSLGVFIMVCLIGGCLLSSRQYNELWGEEKKYLHYMLDLSPGIQIAQWWLADLYLQQGQWEQSREHFQKIVQSKFSDWEAYINLGVIEEELGNNEKAKWYFKKAIEYNPQAAMAYNNVGAIYKKEGGYTMALSFFEKAIEADVYSVEARKNLAVIYIKQCRIEAARRLLKELIIIVPQESYAREKLESLESNATLQIDECLKFLK